MWKKEKSARTLDYVDKNDNLIFQILTFLNKINSIPNRFEDKIYAQVIHKENSDKSELVDCEALNTLIFKCALVAIECGWKIDFSKLDLYPDIENIEVYDSKFIESKIKYNPNSAVN